MDRNYPVLLSADEASYDHTLRKCKCRQIQKRVVTRVLVRVTLKKRRTNLNNFANGKINEEDV